MKNFQFFRTNFTNFFFNLKLQNPYGDICRGKTATFPFL